jgi:hypothetical protein
LATISRSLIDDQLRTITIDPQLQQPLQVELFQDMMGILSEAEYLDVCPPGFFTRYALPSYLRGHFPCGWQGAYPDGQLVV